MKQLNVRFFFVVILLALVFTPLGPALDAWAQEGFNYNYLISDSDLTDHTAMNQDQIQAFLISKGSTLAYYLDPITRMRASQIIYQSAQDFQINPKFLLALIQKEQSLVEDSSPVASQYDWATGYAVCDSCNTNDPLIQKFKGFYNQVYNAAKRIRTVYLVDLQNTGRTSSGYGPGITKLVDGLTVTPANYATSVLYTYTPHLHGNKLMSEVWYRFFARSYPDGTLLNVEGEREVWLIQDGFRRQFANRSVYLSRYNNFDRVLTVNQTDLVKYPEGKPIKFANYSYLRTPQGTVYLLVDDQLRGFASAEALRRVGVNPEEIIDVEQKDLTDYGEGKPITVDSLYPLGALLQDKTSGGVYWVQEGVKQPIWSREIMTTNFPGYKIQPRTSTELATLSTGDPVLFRDGELIKSVDDPAVYLVSNHLRLPFKSGDDFVALGFNWQSIIVTSTAAVNLHPLGEPLVVNF